MKQKNTSEPVKTPR